MAGFACCWLASQRLESCALKSAGEPLVSVIVPSWNSERTLLATLESAAAQTHRNLEIVIVDDGSTDSTAAVASQFCEREPRARLVSKENGGLSSARNFGISKARGRWLAPIDADDLWHPTKIEKQLALALASPEPVGFVYCWYRQVDQAGRVIGTGPRVPLRGHVFSQLGYLNAVENGSALLLSRKAIEKVGGYDESLPALEDVMLQLRVAAQYPIDLVTEHLVGWRRHTTNMSSNVDLIRNCSGEVYARLFAERAPLPRMAARWVRARNAFDTAEQRAGAGSYAAAFAWLAAAIAGDPLRSTAMFAYRSVRSIRRRLGAARPRSNDRLFYDVDPAEPLPMDPYAVPALQQVIRRLEWRRLRRLGRDSALLRWSGSKPSELSAESLFGPVADADPR